MTGGVLRGLTPALAGAAVGLLVLSVPACGPPSPSEAFPELEHLVEPEHGAGAGAVETEVAGTRSEGIRYAGPPPDAVLGSLPKAPVVGFTGPGERPFQVALRTPEVTHYPCTSCHTRPIGTKTKTLEQMHTDSPTREGEARIDCHACHGPNDPTGLVLDCASCHAREGSRELMPSRSAHLTVRLSHPSGKLRNCFTCHRPENPETLALQDGSYATLDEAYRLCAGCHFSQAASWAGGAHGKRLAGWQGERVLLSCTGCHNPHSPKFPVRRPVTFPKIARRGSAR
jgi:Class III cytochrome C family